MFSSFETGAGSTRLAFYIKEAWKNSFRENWWVDITLAEADLLIDDFTNAHIKMLQAIEYHKPDNFELMSTREQISIYAYTTGKQKETATLLAYLKTLSQ